MDRCPCWGFCWFREFYEADPKLKEDHKDFCRAEASKRRKVESANGERDSG